MFYNILLRMLLTHRNLESIMLTIKDLKDMLKMVKKDLQKLLTQLTESVPWVWVQWVFMPIYNQIKFRLEASKLPDLIIKHLNTLKIKLRKLVRNSLIFVVKHLMYLVLGCVMLISLPLLLTLVAALYVLARLPQ